MHNQPFHRSISVDFAPYGRCCEWCGEPADRHLTAIGGKYHNESGMFCHHCGDDFAHAVARALDAASIRNDTTITI